MAGIEGGGRLSVRGPLNLSRPAFARIDGLKRRSPDGALATSGAALAERQSCPRLMVAGGVATRIPPSACLQLRWRSRNWSRRRVELAAASALYSSQ